jgi:hypothetical protein
MSERHEAAAKAVRKAQDEITENPSTMPSALEKGDVADFVADGVLNALDQLEATYAQTLADALDRFFYDLRFTAPEAVGMRLNQLGERITPTMTELGYPKRGVSAEPDSGKAAA